MCSPHSYDLAKSDLYLFWFISQRWLPKRAQQNRVITTVPLVSLIPQAIRICRTLFFTQKKVYRVVIDSESSAGTHGLNPLDHLIMFNKRQSLPLWFIALSKPVTKPDTAQIKAKSSSVHTDTDAFRLEPINRYKHWPCKIYHTVTLIRIFVLISRLGYLLTFCIFIHPYLDKKMALSGLLIKQIVIL